MRKLLILSMLLVSIGMSAQQISVEQAKRNVRAFMENAQVTGDRLQVTEDGAQVTGDRFFGQATQASKLGVQVTEDGAQVTGNGIGQFDNLQLNNSSKRNSQRATDVLTLAFTAEKAGMKQFYVFNTGDNGFVVAGADEIAEPVLAYSENGNFDINNVNPNLKYWLECYQREIEAAKASASQQQSAISGQLSAANARGPKRAKKDVPILVPTRWDQDSPYNDSIKAYTGKAYLTGCVATAMSQVMRTHKWPEMGKGSHEYYDQYESKKSYSRDFEHAYDWDNMRDTYGKSATDEQKGAVAQLMFDAGVSVEMMYNTSMNGGSGAYTENCAYAFANYFRYDEGVHHHYRNLYTLDEWANIVYADLAEGLPVMYGGASADGGGHSFICDGYKASDDTYHFNWGWSGDDDCYAKLSAVKGGGYSFPIGQDIVCGIRKPVEGSKVKPSIILDYEFNMTITETEKDDKSTFTCKCGTYKYDYTTYQGKLMNDSWKAFDCIMAMKYVNQATGESFIAKSENDADNKLSFPSVYPFYGEGTFSSVTVKNVVKPLMPAGDYKVYLAFRDANDSEAEWEIVRGYKTKTFWMDATVESSIDTPEALEATDLTSTGFTANWTEVENAESYTLNFTSTEQNSGETTLLDEDFSGFSKEGTSDISSVLDSYTKEPGWTGKKIYQNINRVKVGTSSDGGTLTSPSMEANGTVRVIIGEESYNNDDTKVTVKIGNAIEQFTASSEEHIFEVEMNGSFSITISSDGAKQRFYLNKIQVIANAGKSETTLIEDIKENKYVFENLDSTKIYTYQVKAVSAAGISEWSNKVEVKLSDGPVPPVPPTPPTPVDTCAVPVIEYADGVLSITSETEGAQCFYTIADNDIKTSFTEVEGDISLGVTYLITAYATKQDAVNSDTVTVMICWLENVPEPTGVIAVKATPVVIQYDGANIAVKGLKDDVEVSVYTIGGMLIASGKTIGGIASIPANVEKGEVVIIKIGDNAIKFKI